MPAGVPLSSQRRANNVKWTSLLSSVVNITRTKTRKGRHGTLSLSVHAVRLLEQQELAKEASRCSVMTQAEQTNYEAFLDFPETCDDTDNGYEDDVLWGNRAANISHAGEGLEDPDEDQADEELLDMLERQQNKVFSRRPRDRRKRADRTQILVDAFVAQLESMTDAYLSWNLAMAEKNLGAEYMQPGDSVLQEKRQVLVVDLFEMRNKEVPIVDGNVFIASAYVRQGLMPSTPHHASVVITVFVQGLCDLHVVAPHPYLGAQFSTAFDVYLSLRAAADQHMKAALGRDIPNWRLKNACPACLYELEGEPKLKRRLIVTQDGNNSLKWFGRPGDVFLPRSEVEEWAKDEVDELMKGFEPEAGEGGDEGVGCEERWENMKEDVTARAWGLYNETGIFPALCRHGFVLVVVDMAQSGELAKYGLSIINHLICVLGEVTVGIDVGCKVVRQVKAHPRPLVLAAENNFKAVVGSFHGLGHDRLCSICNMVMYVDGMGLEDCENCESYFAKSNALASTTCYSTIFHRQQAISTYMRHTDLCDAYQGLTIVIGNKYQHALRIKQGLPALQDAMCTLDVSTRDVFETWLAKEKEYLQSMKKEPVEETNEMEYYQKLVNLYNSEEHLHDIRRVNVFVPAAMDATYAEAVKQTRRLETQCRHAGEATVQDLELRLGIETRWVAGGEEWVKAALMVKNQSYQCAFDQLQGLIVARMFELAKMNMSGTGYKL
ncbi:hypothetical protein B0H14DRAFT_2588627 [Mycena olivaceomarginata]|nr:hypothetical protein B0H14DRAFT_2588627 [Mycena olivaceomarginata]